MHARLAKKALSLLPGTPPTRGCPPLHLPSISQAHSQVCYLAVMHCNHCYPVQSTQPLLSTATNATIVTQCNQCSHSYHALQRLPQSAGHYSNDSIMGNASKQAQLHSAPSPSGRPHSQSVPHTYSSQHPPKGPSAYRASMNGQQRHSYGHSLPDEGSQQVPYAPETPDPLEQRHAGPSRAPAPSPSISSQVTSTSPGWSMAAPWPLSHRAGPQPPHAGLGGSGGGTLALTVCCVQPLCLCPTVPVGLVQLVCCCTVMVLSSHCWCC